MKLMNYLDNEVLSLRRGSLDKPQYAPRSCMLPVPTQVCCNVTPDVKPRWGSRDRSVTVVLIDQSLSIPDQHKTSEILILIKSVNQVFIKTDNRVVET